MSYLKINIIFVLFLFYFLRTNRKGLHILQLEHYYKDRYIKWMKQNLGIVFDFKKIILLLISSVVLVLGYGNIGVVLTIITYEKRKETFCCNKKS